MNKKLLLFSLILSTGIIQESQGAWATRARSIGQKIRPFIVPGFIFGSMVGTSIIRLNAREEFHNQSIATYYEILKDYDHGIPVETISEIKRKFSEKGFSVALKLDSQTTPSVFIGVAKGKDEKVILTLGDLMIKILSNEQPDAYEVKKEMIDALLIHEIDHAVNDDKKHQLLFLKLTSPIIPLATIAGYKAVNRLNIQSRFGKAIALVAGGTIGYLSSFCTSYLLNYKISRSMESRADQAVFATKDPNAIKALRDFFVLLKPIYEKSINKNFDSRNFSQRKRDLILLLDKYTSTHPHPQERIDACDKALKQLEQQDAKDIIKTSFK